jgi:hypothetical protein
MPEVAHFSFSGTTVLTVTLRDDFANTAESAGALASRLASDYAAYTHLRHAACYIMHNKTEYAKGTFWASAYEPPVA